MLTSLDLLLRIVVLYIAEITSANEQVLVAVQIHIQKHGRPGPIGRGKSGIKGNRSEGSIPTVEKQRVPHHLRPILDSSPRSWQRHLRKHLSLSYLRISL